jgi:protein-export membrane protein SecD
MFGTLKGRIALLALMTLLAAVSLIRNGISLGLDLRGGMHLALEIDDPDNTYTDEAKADFIDQTLYVLRNRIDQFGVAEPVVQKVGSERIIVELPGIDDEERARGIIEQQAFLEWKLVRPSTDLTNPLQRMDRLVTAALRERGALPAETTAAADTTAATDTTQRRETVQDLLFGRADTAAADTATAPSERPLSSLIYSTGSQGEFVVAEQDVQRVKEYLSLPGVIGALPRGAELRWGAVPTGQGAQLYRPLYILEREPFITGDRLENATAGRDPQFNQTIVSFQLDRRGGNTFEQVTSRHIGDRIAIVLDTLVHSAPTVEGRIGSSGQITMGAGASMQEASDLALVLRAGSLPAGITIVEQRSIGPSLGQDSIDQGKLAGIIGILFVITLMIVYYRLAGALAVLALCFYLLLRARRSGRIRREPDGARHCRPHPVARHGRRRERSDLRAHPRGAARRQIHASGRRRRVPARDVGDRRLEHHHAVHGSDPVPGRDRARSKASRSRSHRHRRQLRLGRVHHAYVLPDLSGSEARRRPHQHLIGRR